MLLKIEVFVSLATLFIALSVAIPLCVVNDNEKRKGNDINPIIKTLNSPEECCKACRENPKCVAWTWTKDKKWCRLKNAAGTVTANQPNKASGLVFRTLYVLSDYGQNCDDACNERMGTTCDFSTLDDLRTRPHPNRDWYIWFLIYQVSKGQICCTDDDKTEEGPKRPAIHGHHPDGPFVCKGWSGDAVPKCGKKPEEWERRLCECKDPFQEVCCLWDQFPTKDAGKTIQIHYYTKQDWTPEEIKEECCDRCREYNLFPPPGTRPYHCDAFYYRLYDRKGPCRAKCGLRDKAAKDNTEVIPKGPLYGYSMLNKDEWDCVETEEQRKGAFGGKWGPCNERACPKPCSFCLGLNCFDKNWHFCGISKQFPNENVAKCQCYGGYEYKLGKCQCPTGFTEQGTIDDPKGCCKKP